nr:MAG TPA: hypothetical protein [Bacteriophage sp.]
MFYPYLFLFSFIYKTLCNDIKFDSNQHTLRFSLRPLLPVKSIFVTEQIKSFRSLTIFIYLYILFYKY